MAARKSKRIPAIYHSSAPLQLGTAKNQEIKNGQAKLETDNYQLVLETLKQNESLRMLHKRLDRLQNDCTKLMDRHWGVKPEHIADTDWELLETKIRVTFVSDLEPDVPAECRYALLGLKCISKIRQIISADTNQAEGPFGVISLAIDLGHLLQRMHTQVEIGATVDAGRKNEAAVSKMSLASNKTRSKSKVTKSDYVHDHYVEIFAKHPDWPDTRILQEIRRRLSKQHQNAGGEFDLSDRTFKRYKSEWKKSKRVP